ncbi:MAG TPA: hypothetical protein VFX29_05705, partial [Longimicrobiaceae bacterium]|nr:hypothetical protein [Longimicrobiaceae bacterium]
MELAFAVSPRRPLVCLIDDLRWMDQVSVQLLQFVARRLLAEPIAMIFAIRESNDGPQLAGLRELVIDGLADADARQLLDAAMPGRMDERVRERILAEARGNPLALLELPHDSSPASVAGGFGLPSELALQRRIEASFQHRVERLPRATQQLLLVAAAEPTGEPTLLWRTAAELGLTIDAVGAAEE